MDDNIKWITRNGVHIPITNDYMNNKIRTAIKKNEKDFKGHFQDKESKYEIVNGEYKEIKNDAYYQLDNGEKIQFLDKKEYKDMTNRFYDSLNDDEKKALHFWINDPTSLNSPIYKHDKDYEEIMNNIFKNKAIELQNDTLLFRRASDDYLDLENGVSKKNAISTSAYDTIPKTMPSGKPFGNKELYIIAPKGTKVLPIEKVAVNHPQNDENDKKIYARQHEMVLPKETNYELVDDLSTYYYRPAKGNETRDVETTDQKYVVRLTNNKYNKKEYSKPKYYWQQNANGYENYVYNHNGKDISIKEVYKGDRDTKFKKRPRKEVIKYRVSDMAFKGKEEYYDTYDDAVEAIKKYL